MRCKHVSRIIIFFSLPFFFAIWPQKAESIKKFEMADLVV